MSGVATAGHVSEMSSQSRDRKARVSWLPLAASPVVLVLAAVAGWWLVGDMSFRPPPGVLVDYFVVPPAMGVGVTDVAGTAALVLEVITLLVSAWTVRAGRMRGSWLTLMVVLALCGLAIGWSGRVLTAGGIGANIGAGLVLVFLGPAVGVVVLLALSRALYLTRRGPPR